MNTIKRKIGIVGGGQLGKMMVLEAKRLGFYVAVLDPTEDCPAHSIVDEHIVADFDNADGYRQLAEKVGADGVITYEYEHINADVLEELVKEGYIVYPSPTSLSVIKNKFYQKLFLKEYKIPVPQIAEISCADDIIRAGMKFGFPLMLKTVTGGYDGKGNALIEDGSQAETAFNSLGGGKVGLMAEELIDFEKEISVIICRAIDGKNTAYPISENIHKDSILDTSIVPARIDLLTATKATGLATEVAEMFETVGAFCVEMFVTKTGELYVNEVAPRPHNSGHYTIEGCFANQFENHIRAVMGLPLGDTRLIQPTVMVNLLGESEGAAKIEGLEKAYLAPKVHVHFYGKSLSKIGRKMGHFTIVDNKLDMAVIRAKELKKIVRIVGEQEQ